MVRKLTVAGWEPALAFPSLRRAFALLSDEVDASLLYSACDPMRPKVSNPQAVFFITPFFSNWVLIEIKKVTKVSKLGSISDMLRATNHAGVTAVFEPAVLAIGACDQSRPKVSNKQTLFFLK